MSTDLPNPTRPKPKTRPLVAAVAPLLEPLLTATPRIAGASSRQLTGSRILKYPEERDQ